MTYADILRKVLSAPELIDLCPSTLDRFARRLIQLQHQISFLGASDSADVFSKVHQLRIGLDLGENGMIQLKNAGHTELSQLSQNGSNERTVLSGHGGCRAYLYRFGGDDSSYCPTCVMIPEDAEHVVFNCPRFAAHRAEEEIDTGVRLTPENIVQASETSGRAVEKLMKATHNLLKKEEFRNKVANNDTRCISSW